MLVMRPGCLVKQCILFRVPEGGIVGHTAQIGQWQMLPLRRRIRRSTAYSLPVRSSGSMV
jgi:hypothetical protein